VVETHAIPEMAVSCAEVERFQRDGFLIRRGLLPPSTCAAIRDRLWAANTSAQLRREDPTTWVGPLPPEDLPSNRGGLPGNPSYSFTDHRDWDDVRSEFTWRYRRMGNEPLLLHAVRSAAWEIAQALVHATHGPGKLVEPVAGAPWRPDRGAGQNLDRGRGVLCNLPRPPGSRRTPIANGTHVDQFPFHLGMCAYIDRVEPGGGGFT
jgi:hypothetical protein